MSSYPFALYDAFTTQRFGGSQAAIVTNASDIGRSQRERIAGEIGMPATAFVEATGSNWVEAQFMSTIMELPMCGHGTLCLMTHLLETGLLSSAEIPYEAELRLPNSVATVSLSANDNGRNLVMLDVRIPGFDSFSPDPTDLMALLGLRISDLEANLPIEIVRGDFVHLMVPLAGLAPMRAIQPDFAGIVRFCQDRGLETIAVFCTEVEQATNQVHLRDFCPAVGVSESAAAGTTNAAMTAYLIRHGIVPTATKKITVNAEQGIELGRPSLIQSIASLSDQRITRLQVGGIATRVVDGNIYLQADDAI